MSTIKIPEDCKACYMNITYGRVLGKMLDCQKNFEHGVCPCSICLVKTMCQSICDLYREFANDAIH